MTFSKPITEIIRQRFSCRAYGSRPIEEKLRGQLREYLASCGAGPLGGMSRFGLIAATDRERDSLKGLGTYGFIKGKCGFVAGAMSRSQHDVEDFGYLMELIVLFAADLGLGTCWLGGSFTRSSFAKNICLEENEQMPAVISIGSIADPENARSGWIRRRVKADRRIAWEKLFFNKKFGVPLTRDEAEKYGTPLEMVRIGPSGSNKQPWRIIKDDNRWHFYLQRTKGYRGWIVKKLLKIADIQRIDMGIAMCHFELTAQELGLKGAWVVQDPAIGKTDNLTEYTVSWVI